MGQSAIRNKNDGGRFLKAVPIIGVLISLMAFVATTYFEIYGRSTKEISLTYIVKQPLLVSGNLKAPAKIEVNVAGKRVNTPWLVSGRFENTGSLPIEERDINSPVQLDFKKIKIINANVNQKSQNAIFAKVRVVEGNKIQIQHKLLNPGDWIVFDALFDGEPILPADSDFRISGVPNIKSYQQLTGQVKSFPLVFEASPTLTYISISVTSFLAVLLIFLGSVLIVGGIKYKNITSNNQNEPTVSNKIDWSTILAGLLMVIFGVLLGFVVGGSWRTLLGM